MSAPGHFSAIYTSGMRAAVLTFVLSVGTTVHAAGLPLFYQEAKPLTPAADQALKATIEHDGVPHAGVLVTTFGFGFMGVGATWPMAVVLLPARESTPGLCRGAAKLYAYDDASKKWISYDAMPRVPHFGYFFKPAMKLKCERVLAAPALVSGTVSDADLLGIVDSIRSARMEKSAAAGLTYPRNAAIQLIAHEDDLPGETITPELLKKEPGLASAIASGRLPSDVATVYIANRSIYLLKRDSGWWISSVDDTAPEQ